MNLQDLMAMMNGSSVGGQAQRFGMAQGMQPGQMPQVAPMTQPNTMPTFSMPGQSGGTGVAGGLNGTPFSGNQMTALGLMGANLLNRNGNGLLGGAMNPQMLSLLPMLMGQGGGGAGGLMSLFGGGQ